MNKYSSPIDASLVDELFGFWDRIFSEEHDIPPDAFLGMTDKENGCDVYVERRKDKIVATCNIIYPRENPQLGGLGEVATDPTYRQQGLATNLCRQALADFRDRGGQAIFLGTNNWSAGRIYHRLGWRKLAGSNVMANISSGDSPETFLVDYFRPLGSVTVQTGGPFLRVPIIPLLNMPHDWQILDANIGMLSTRYETQQSCNGLYRRYFSGIPDGGCGACFAAVTDDGRIVGLSTARLGESGECQVDGFAHSQFTDHYGDLMDAAIQWGKSSNATGIYSKLSIEDEEKQRLFESLSFRKLPMKDVVGLGDRKVQLVQFRK